MSSHDVADIIEVSCHEDEPLERDSADNAAPNSPVSDNTTPYGAEVLADHIAKIYDQKLLKITSDLSQTQNLLKRSNEENNIMFVKILDLLQNPLKRRKTDHPLAADTDFVVGGGRMRKSWNVDPDSDVDEVPEPLNPLQRWRTC